MECQEARELMAPAASCSPACRVWAYPSRQWEPLNYFRARVIFTMDSCNCCVRNALSSRTFGRDLQKEGVAEFAEVESKRIKAVGIQGEELSRSTEG